MTTKGLVCSTTANSCNCPQSTSANACDCPSTGYYYDYVANSCGKKIYFIYVLKNILKLNLNYKLLPKQLIKHAQIIMNAIQLNL